MNTATKECLGCRYIARKGLGGIWPGHTCEQAFQVGRKVSVTGWGYTETATVTAATSGEVTVDHPWKGVITFTLRRNGMWVSKGFAATYAPEMKPSWP